VYQVGKRKRSEVIAFCLDDKADDVAAFDIENALLDQILIDRSIEERVVDDVVDMQVHVVVDPACRDHLKMRVLFTCLRLWAGHVVLE
jgi:hypothetical protein